MHQYKITLRDGTERAFVASSFATVGDFVDFFEWNGASDMTILRLRAADVESIERQKKD